MVWQTMNERIKELSKQAGDYVNEVYTPPVRSKTPGKIWEDGHVDWHTQFNEKFAQLIVRECLDIAKRTRDNFGSANPDVLEGGRGCAFCVYHNIKNTFGVEE